MTTTSSWGMAPGRTSDSPVEPCPISDDLKLCGTFSNFVGHDSYILLLCSYLSRASPSRKPLSLGADGMGRRCPPGMLASSDERARTFPTQQVVARPRPPNTTAANRRVDRAVPSVGHDAHRPESP